MPKFSVHEYRGEGETSPIGTVNALSKKHAIEKAHQKYGAPIDVRPE